MSTIAALAEQIGHVKALCIAVERGQRKRAPIERAAGITSRLHTCLIMAKLERRDPGEYALEHFPRDRDLHQLIEKAATGPTTTADAALVVDVVQDIADNLLGASVLSQLRERGLSYVFTPGGGIVRAPAHSPTASGAFVAEGQPIPLGALLLTSLRLSARKAASIIAATRELFQSSPQNVEASLRTLLAEDLSLMADGILLSANAATAAAPAGLLFGLTPLTPSPVTGGAMLNALLTDIKALLAAISPSVRPCLIMGTGQAASLGIVAPSNNAPVIVAPFLPAGVVIAVDAAAFASALGPLSLTAAEDVTLHHEDTVPLPIVGGVAQPPAIGAVAAPVRSMFQTATVAIRAMLPADWVLRRPNAVSFINGVNW